MHEYPLDPGERARIRDKIHADQAALAETNARQLSRSHKCGVNEQHTGRPGGCANDGTGCLCHCHDRQEGPAASRTDQDNTLGDPDVQ